MSKGGTMNVPKELEVLRNLRPSFRIVSPVAVLAFLLAMLPVLPASAQTTTPPPNADVPIVGTVTGGGTFNGIMRINGFAAKNGQVVAFGTITGILTDVNGVASSVISSISAPVNVAQATCQILHLDLGPLSLNLLGLHVDLSRVVLDITAESAPGNLLGNLLCGIAGLLDNPGGLARALNALLGGLLG
jgi:hypothetical protein